MSHPPNLSQPPNLVFIMSDDHAAHAISAYGSRINETPHIDRIANEGMRFNHCYCTNSICTPSRAAILCGTYNHVNKVTTLETPLDAGLVTFPKLLQEAGYATAIFGKWHLGDSPEHHPRGFDEWEVLPGQGDYHDPMFLRAEGPVVHEGYVSDVICDLSISWLRGLAGGRSARGTASQTASQPFALLCHHKAPHRPWEPDEAHALLYEDETIPEPATFWDDYATRTTAAYVAKCQMMDLTEADLKAPVPPGLSEREEISWRYQRYIKDYLRVVASVDDNTGRLLDELEALGLAENTIVVYTSDQGFFLGEHGWFDKRFMYEESLNMPLLVRWPGVVEPGSVCDQIVTNVDFAQTFLEAAGVNVSPAGDALSDRSSLTGHTAEEDTDTPFGMQGRSFVPLLRGETPDDWPQSMYYRYWMHRDQDHNIFSHLGVRTKTHKLICFYNDPLEQPGAHASPDGTADPPEWELYDLIADPFEVNNLYGNPGQEAITQELKTELNRLIQTTADTPPPYLTQE